MEQCVCITCYIVDFSLEWVKKGQECEWFCILELYVNAHFSPSQVFFHELLELSHAHLEAALGVISPTANPEKDTERVERFAV